MVGVRYAFTDVQARSKKETRASASNNRLVDHIIIWLLRARSAINVARRMRFACRGTISLDRPAGPAASFNPVFLRRCACTRGGIAVESRGGFLIALAPRLTCVSESRRRFLALGFSHLHNHARLDLTCD